MKRREFIAGLAGAAAWPIAAGAQQRQMPVIGFMNGASAGLDAGEVEFRKGLSETDYVEGRNVAIEYRWAESRYDRLPALAADLVRRRVAVIVSQGAPASLAATAATSTIPIVFASGFDPVELGLVARLSRPGGNVTGVLFLTQAVIAKRLELLHEIVPAATLIGLLVNPTTPSAEAQIKEAETAARALGVQLAIRNASTPSEIDAAFAILVDQRIGALLAGTDVLFAVQYNQLVALAARHAVPAIYSRRNAVEAGGLMSYGTDFSDAWRLSGNYAGRILKGEKPGNLPVQQSTRIEMVLNLKTAKALGLSVPPSTLLRADEVIE
jgi:putative tryptophan/tyrosine transport system substrate-binding protein